MGPLIVAVAGLGVAVALTSPGSVVTVIALLSMSSGVRRALAFIAGWLVTIGLLAALTLVVLQGQDFHSKHTTPSRAASAVEVFLGCLLVIVAALAYRRPRRQPKSQSPPKWLGRIDRSHWLLEVVVGAIMLSYALTLTAAAETLKAHVSTADAALAELVFAVTSIITIAAPVVIVLVAPERSTAVLTTSRDWVLAHSRPIALIALMVIGSLIAVRGAYDLVA
jgi:Sap-like sulfolipid-1-addressing protein